MSSIYGNVHSTNTIIGLINQLNTQIGITDKINLDCTLNKKHNLDINTQPLNCVTIRYFGIGVRGCYSTIYDSESVGDVTALVSPTTPYRPSAENMDLYFPIPFRTILGATGTDPLLTADPSEREKYRLHSEYTPQGSTDVYHLYWLKKIVFDADTITNGAITKRITVADNEEIEYALNPDNLEPIPTISLISEVTDRINVNVSGTCEIKANEIAEAVALLYGGNVAYAHISEVGFYTGEDNTPVGNDAIEAVGAQLAIHRCMSSIDMSVSGSILTLPVVIANGSSVISGTYLNTI